MNVYFDNAATTCVRSEAAELMLKVMTEDFGNVLLPYDPLPCRNPDGRLTHLPEYLKIEKNP